TRAVSQPGGKVTNYTRRGRKGRGSGLDKETRRRGDTEHSVILSSPCLRVSLSWSSGHARTIYPTLHALEEACQDAAGADFVELVEARGQQVADRLLPKHGLEDLLDEQAANLGRVRVRLGIDVGPHRDARRLDGHAGERRGQRFVGWLHQRGVKRTGHG